MFCFFPRFLGGSTAPGHEMVCKVMGFERGRGELAMKHSKAFSRGDSYPLHVLW